MMQIRLASLAEHETLKALQWRASLANADDRDALLSESNVVKLPMEQIEAGWVTVAEDCGRPRGFPVIVPGRNGIVELDGLFVDPKFWRRGVGRLLVDHCAAMAKQLGARPLEVVSNRLAHSFYEKCGFQRRGTVRTQFAHGIAMSKTLG